ncbi:MAG: hydroxymethylpyrimidine/phosphomethylpyrimidine kinase [Chromatiales bacterium 21-64-14]|nr:MAG: hydroxymethylpyrimidine/phosphomethylpyrimidine kinase [Chromatiales bacterium 21-64-14]HQU16593.1 hydroxymethylpyrimidine/phosphomethylpyrimidine kinase [Gammaproteobacteria bacterium]
MLTPITVNTLAPNPPPPVVLAISGHDPCGGAGIQADIEALASLGCHTAPVVSAVTVQDTQTVHGYMALDPILIVQQARAVLEDLPVAAVKIGMLGSVGAAQAVHTLLRDYADLPVVLDPVLAAGAGGALAPDGLREALIALLLPLTTVLTPNSHEARALAPEGDTLDACAMALLEHGCAFVLITGTHEPGAQVINRLYGEHRILDTTAWERLAGSYHGSGCTLAAAIAGLLAQGCEPRTAVREAQRYTWETLRHGYRLGSGQSLPRRLYWSDRGRR